MFYIPHGSTKIVDNKEYQFNARKYEWRTIPKDLKEHQDYITQEAYLSKEWEDNNCHPNGVFFCPRCYRKHFVFDNFDFLCDGCTTLLKEHHSYGACFEFTDRFNEWYANVPQDILNARIELRQRLDDVYKAASITLKDKKVIVVRDPLQNNGNLEFCFSESDITKKESRFICNIKDLVINQT